MTRTAALLADRAVRGRLRSAPGPSRRDGGGRGRSLRAALRRNGSSSGAGRRRRRRHGAAAELSLLAGGPSARQLCRRDDRPDRFAAWVERMQGLDRDARKAELANLPRARSCPAASGRTPRWRSHGRHRRRAQALRRLAERTRSGHRTAARCAASASTGAGRLRHLEAGGRAVLVHAHPVRQRRAQVPDPGAGGVPAAGAGPARARRSCCLHACRRSDCVGGGTRPRSWRARGATRLPSPSPTLQIPSACSRRSPRSGWWTSATTTIASARSCWARMRAPASIPSDPSSTDGSPTPATGTRCSCSSSTACGCRRVPRLRLWTCSADTSTESSGASPSVRTAAPLVYDSIHSCGCYHQFFPTPRAQPLPPQDTLDEQAFVPQQLPAVRGRQPRRSAAGDGNPLHPARAGRHRHARDRLRLRTGRCAAFAARIPPGAAAARSARDGIVPGSERGERYVFWPMGVREPGAMREWGRHATAFIGRRHFDEARLIERYFILQLN